MTKTGAEMFLATSTNLGQFRHVQGYGGVVFELKASGATLRRITEEVLSKQNIKKSQAATCLG